MSKVIQAALNPEAPSESSDAGVALTHLFTFFRSLGGAQSILRQHHSRDRHHHIDSHFVALFEPDHPPVQRLTGLALSWKDSIRTARRKFAALAASFPPHTALYHNGWGCPFLADLDRAHRRLAMLHTLVPDLRAILDSQRGLLDGVICVNQTLRDIAAQHLPELARERIDVLPSPICIPERLPEHPPLAGRPVVLGYSGRVQRLEKRVDRLLPLCRALRSAEIDFQLEILGEGAELDWLKKELRDLPQVHFHGRVSGKEYTDRLGRCDFIVFVSDFEGLPLSLLEALSLGVLPLYPEIHSGGDRFVTELRKDLLYPRYEFACVAQLLKRLQNTAPEHIDALRRRARQLVEPHAVDNYLERFGQFIRYIEDLPRVSADRFGRRPFFWSDPLPFALLRRVHEHGLLRPTPARRT